MSHIYQDLEFITGMEGLFTHMLPNVLRSVEPWLKKEVNDSSYWDGEYNPELAGDYPLEPMSSDQRALMLMRYRELPNPLAGKDVIAVSV